MEVRVYRQGADGTQSIESHAIPALVGNSVTTGRDDRTTTESDSDSVDEVLETVEVGPSVGVTICRRVLVGRGDSDDPRRVYDKGRRTIVTPEDLAGDVTRVDVDGEQVWPAEDGDAARPAPAPAPEPEPKPAPTASSKQAPTLASLFETVAAQAPGAPRPMADYDEPGLTAADEDYIGRLIEDGLGI